MMAARGCVDYNHKRPFQFIAAKEWRPYLGPFFTGALRLIASVPAAERVPILLAGFGGSTPVPGYQRVRRPSGVRADPFASQLLESWSSRAMRMISGALLLLAAEQAFAHAHQIGFPYQIFAREILLPSSLVLALAGIGFFIWGLFTESKTS